MNWVQMARDREQRQIPEKAVQWNFGLRDRRPSCTSVFWTPVSGALHYTLWTQAGNPGYHSLLNMELKSQSKLINMAMPDACTPLFTASLLRLQRCSGAAHEYFWRPVIWQFLSFITSRLSFCYNTTDSSGYDYCLMEWDSVQFCKQIHQHFSGPTLSIFRTTEKRCLEVSPTPNIAVLCNPHSATPQPAA